MTLQPIKRRVRTVALHHARKIKHIVARHKCAARICLFTATVVILVVLREPEFSIVAISKMALDMFAEVAVDRSAPSEWFEFAAKTASKAVRKDL